MTQIVYIIFLPRIHPEKDVNNSQSISIIYIEKKRGTLCKYVDVIYKIILYLEEQLNRRLTKCSHISIVYQQVICLIDFSTPTTCSFPNVL